MKKNLFLLLVVATIAAIPTKLMAQAQKSTTASVELIAPMAIDELSTMAFGVLSVLSTGSGTCQLKTDGTRALLTGAAGITLATAPASTAAQYDVTGDKGTTYAVTLPATITVTDPVSTQTLTINTIVALLASSPAADQAQGSITGTIDATSGKDNIKVGGNLVIPVGKPTGAYSGSFNISVNYN